MRKQLSLLWTIFGLIGLVHPACQSVGVNDWNLKIQPMNVTFGLKDSTNGSPPYAWSIGNGWYSAAGDYYLYTTQRSAIYNMHISINQIPLQGGLNMTLINASPPSSFGRVEGFIPTASFTCQSATSAVWGPAYPDVRQEDYRPRARFPNIQVYSHYSVPEDSSYIRQILYIKNTGAASERVEIWGQWWNNVYSGNISPKDNEGRYYTGFPFQDGDEGQFGDFPATRNTYIIGSVHIAGLRAQDKTGVITADPSYFIISPNYQTVLGSGQEFALMLITSFGLNRSLALTNAADIDIEPAYIFHDLSADQLSMIRNWGGCQVIIGPSTTVAITPPSQCVSGQTNDFTVQVSSSRNDLTTAFIHQVIGQDNKVLVAKQSSTTLAVPNGTGSVKHQLWYKECLVKETTFNGCNV